MRFWIDVANSPHAPLFAPISRELEGRGHEVIVTAWDRAQTRELALGFWPEAIIIGTGNTRGVLAKGLRIWRRAEALRHAIVGRGPDIALGHNSYAQLISARRLRLPTITMMDYEHQPANHLAFRVAQRVVVPETFPEDMLHRFGASRKALRYPGFKEEITLADFVPRPNFRAELGVGAEEILAVCRPAPEGALYHRHSNTLFDEAVLKVASEEATVILSPRNRPQAERYQGIRNLRVLHRPVAGADLLFAADLVVGAGGTMTREAAILGTPSYTLFSGRLSAVDAALVAAGKLVPIRTATDLETLRARRKPMSISWVAHRDLLLKVVVQLEEAAGAMCKER